MVSLGRRINAAPLNNRNRRLEGLKIPQRGGFFGAACGAISDVVNYSD
jgi:hypothetical protein